MMGQQSQYSFRRTADNRIEIIRDGEHNRYVPGQGPLAFLVEEIEAKDKRIKSLMSQVAELQEELADFRLAEDTFWQYGL